MDVRLVRDATDAGSRDATLGVLFVDGVLFCQTQEPPARADVFVPGESCLPAGRYNLSLSYCRRFRCDLPLLASTSATDRRRQSDRLGMRVHPGHSSTFSPLDTCGEVLLGQARDGRTVSRTRPAFEAFWGKIRAALAAGEAIDVEIT